MAYVTMKQLLEAGVHFGHQTRRWNPKMKPYIFGARNGIYIVDLQKTVKLFGVAYEFVRDLAASGGTILFVGTKRQAQDTIVEEASRAGMPYVQHRWLGGMLTNFATIRKSVEKLRKIEAMFEEGTVDRFPKKEVLKLDRLRQKLERNLGGIKNMESLPDALFVVDAKQERIAVLEANKLGIPVVAIVDTNTDPDGIDYIIPGNDDAIRAIRLITSRIADAVVEGRAKYEEEVQAATDKEASLEGEEGEEAPAVEPAPDLDEGAEEALGEEEAEPVPTEGGIPEEASDIA